MFAHRNGHPSAQMRVLNNHGTNLSQIGGMISNDSEPCSLHFVADTTDSTIPVLMGSIPGFDLIFCLPSPFLLVVVRKNTLLALRYMPLTFFFQWTVRQNELLITGCNMCSCYTAWYCRPIINDRSGRTNPFKTTGIHFSIEIGDDF